MTIPKQSIRQNLKWLAIVNVVSKPVWFVFLMYSARALGPDEFGRYMLSVGIISLFTGLLEGGVDIHTMRTLAADNQRYRAMISYTLWIKTASGIAAVALAYALGSVIPAFMPDLSLFLAAAVYGTANLILTHIRIVIRSFEIMKYEAFSIIVEKVLVMLLCGIVLFVAPTAEWFGVMFAAAYAVVCVVSVLMVVRTIGLPDRPRQFVKNFFEIIRPSLPFAMMNMFIIVYLRSGTLLLSYLTGDDTAVGYFNAGFRLVEAFVLVPSILVAPLYPVWTRLISDIAAIRLLSLDALRIISAISIAIAFPVALFHREFTALVFGEQYSPAAESIGIICASMVPIGLNWIVGSLVAISGRQRIANWCILAVTIVNIGLHIYLIQGFGVIGAAITVLITELLIMFSNWWIIREYLPFDQVAPILGKIVLSMLISGVVVNIIPGISAINGIFVSVLLLAVGYGLTGVIRSSDARTLFKIEAPSDRTDDSNTLNLRG